MVLAGKSTASIILFAALPVGASNVILSSQFISFLCNSLYISTIDLIIVVFPVPGPPVIIKK